MTAYDVLWLLYLLWLDVRSWALAVGHLVVIKIQLSDIWVKYFLSHSWCFGHFLN